MAIINHLPFLNDALAQPLNLSNTSQPKSITNDNIQEFIVRINPFSNFITDHNIKRYADHHKKGNQ